MANKQDHIHPFVRQCLRYFLGIRWLDKISNKDIWLRINHVQMEIGVSWPHHDKAKHQHYKTDLDLEPSGPEKEGNDKNTWRRDLEADITETGLSWKQLEMIAQDRRRWREVAPGGAMVLSM